MVYDFFSTNCWKRCKNSRVMWRQPVQPRLILARNFINNNNNNNRLLGSSITKSSITKILRCLFYFFDAVTVMQFCRICGIIFSLFFSIKLVRKNVRILQTLYLFISRINITNQWQRKQHTKGKNLNGLLCVSLFDRKEINRRKTRLWMY